MSLGNGVHVLSREEYDRSSRVNWSKLKHLGRSPAHYRHAQMTPVEDTEAMKFGRCAHLAVLEPEGFRAECAVWDGGRRAGKEWETFKLEHDGQELLKEDEYERCIALQSAVRSDRHAGPYLRDGVAEVSLFWTYEVPALGGVEGFSIDCKSRLDFVAPDALVDLKTTRDASQAGFGKQCWSLRYLGQAAFYRDAYAALTGRSLPYRLIAAEHHEPYVCQVYTLSEEQLELGREEYRDLLSRLQLCRTTNNWPGYADGELELELPRWARPSDEDEDVSDLGIHFPAAAEQGA